MTLHHFLVFDLGATSGRCILGSIGDGSLNIKELSRFPNKMLPLGGHLHWNIFSLYEHLREGLAIAAKEGVEITSAGINTWGVDFALVAGDGSILSMPYAYRDPHTSGAAGEYFDKVCPREDVYSATGIQIMDINSLYQLYALKRDDSSILKAAHKLLFMPDALGYMLTGKMTTEYTIASTSQILNPKSKRFEFPLVEKMGIEPSLFCDIVLPGTILGTINDELAASTGIGKIRIVSVAGHDTASAVAAVPSPDSHFAYLSSGTWSLMGIEVTEPVITQQTMDLNITNEGGVEGTTRLLKNMTGMWITEQCLESWKREGTCYTYPQMVEMAEGAAPFKAFIDPDHAMFASPGNMCSSIDAYLAATGQPPLESHGEYIRTIFESLALKYRETLDTLRGLAPFPIDRLHIIGGGSQNKLLNQFTANSTSTVVVAGPTEATSIGNLMMQARAAGVVSTLAQMRRMVSESIHTEKFEPHDSAIWEEAYRKFIIITKK